MKEILYRIYEVAPDEVRKDNLSKALDCGIYSSTSKNENIELLMDVLICEDRDAFKDIIRSMYGNDIKFSYSRKLKEGELYCIIIGEHCYNTEQYFSKVEFECDCCGSKVQTYWDKSIYLHKYEISSKLYNIEEYNNKRFCSNKCKNTFLETESRKIRPDDDAEFYVDRSMFDADGVIGYIYKITKKSTNEFYIGQSKYIPMFRWCQHLKTERFDQKNLLDYNFEVIYMVKKGENILDIEKQYIQQYFNENPTLSLNVVHANSNINTNDSDYDMPNLFNSVNNEL